MPRQTCPSPHALDPLTEIVGRLMPSLRRGTQRRIAKMAQAMQQAALNDGACEFGHLRAAGFGHAEICAGAHLARRALQALDLPEEALAPWCAADRRLLRDAAHAYREAA